MSKPTHLSTLRKCKRIVEGYRARLASAPANQWPEGFDSVVVAEHLSALAHEVHVFDRGADVPAYGIKGIASVPAFLGAYWLTVETLLQCMHEPAAVRVYMDTLSGVLAKEIKDMTE
jgi:hypothetical protein